ncbi:SUKH-4 family immunity protein [Streptomyces sp. NPDC096048]|uniref:SUKH-4 family immunity protein n=1 Tax=Streptomyces sp. NPDC096048 TaxID=3366072 RepID=UPI00381906EA
MHEVTTDTADTAYTTTRTPARVPLFWTSSAVIGCLLVSAGRRTASGLALDLSYRLLAGEFGRDRVVRYEDIDFPPALTHEPTRRFLSETGLPENAFPLAADDDWIPLPTLAEHYGDGALGEAAGHLVRLGRLPDGSDVVVDGPTGTVLTWHPSETTLRPLTPDVSTLVFTLWLLRRAGAVESVTGFEPA